MEKQRNSSQAKAYHIICQRWWRQCYGTSIYGCQWNWHTSVPADGKINFEVTGYDLCSDSAKAAKLIRANFTVHMDIDPKHIAKGTQDFFKANKLDVLQ